MSLVGGRGPCYRARMIRALGCAWLVLLVACGGVRVASVRTATPREIQRLESLARNEMRCPVPLRVTALEAGAYALDGCGTSREYAHVCTGRRCVFQPIVPAILRASGDLQCAPELLTTAAQSPTHRAYYGCSRGAAYELVCVDRGCTWSRTPEVVALAAPQPPPVIPTYTTDPTLTDVAIPPPPGATPPPAPSDAVVPPPPS